MTYHHPSEMVPEPPEGYVVQSPYVKALMDTGSQALQADKDISALKGKASLYGEEFHDFVRGGPVDKDQGMQMIGKIFEKDPEAWASIARATLLQAQTAEDEQELEWLLVRHAAIIIGWITAVQRRTPVGAAG